VSSPRNGAFGASVFLQRLPYSFFSAHLLYRLGHRYEGHAVARLILEQIAWAYAAHTMTEISDIIRIKTTKAISQLKRRVPSAGRTYGFLSEKTHIDYSNLLEFLKIYNEKSVVLLTQPNFREYAVIMLELADLFGIVWELSQFEYIPDPETVIKGSNGIKINSERPFLAEMNSLLLEFDKVAGDGEDEH